MSAIEINGGLQNESPQSLDRYYAKFVSGVTIPYASIQEANTAIPLAYRGVGKTVLVSTNGSNREYWYQGGTADNNLVLKDLTIVGGTNVTVQQVGNVVTVSTSSVTVGDSSTMETFVASGSFNKSFAAGTILTSFLLDPPDDNSYTISVGTTPSGGEIFNAYTVDGTDPQFFQYMKYFKNSQTWYFTGIPAGTLVAILYRPSIALT